MSERQDDTGKDNNKNNNKKEEGKNMREAIEQVKHEVFFFNITGCASVFVIQNILRLAFTFNPEKIWVRSRSERTACIYAKILFTMPFWSIVVEGLADSHVIRKYNASLNRVMDGQYDVIGGHGQTPSLFDLKKDSASMPLKIMFC